MRLDEETLRAAHVRFVGDDADAMWYWVAEDDGGELVDASGPFDSETDARIDHFEREGYTLYYVLSRAVEAHIRCWPASGTEEVGDGDEDALVALDWLDERPGYMLAVLDANDGVCDGCGVFGQLCCAVFDER